MGIRVSSRTRETMMMITTYPMWMHQAVDIAAFAVGLTAIPALCWALPWSEEEILAIRDAGLRLKGSFRK